MDRQPRHKASAVLGGVDPALLHFALAHDLYITCGRDGLHNAGSKHPIGRAIDVRSAGMVEHRVQMLKTEAHKAGLTLIDERKRLPGEVVWGGPHLHIQV